MILARSSSTKRFQKLKDFRVPLMKQSSLPMLLTDLAAVKIQRFYRGYRGRKIYRDRSLFSYRKRYQKQFETMEGLMRFKFQQYGAALVLQRWFRSWQRVRKAVWHKRQRLVKMKMKRQKILLRAIFKSKTSPFTQADLDDRAKLHTACVIVIQRLCRGFIGRRRFAKHKKWVTDTAASRRAAAMIMQSVGRMYLAQTKYYPLGLRYRRFVRKCASYHKRQGGARAAMNVTGLELYPAGFDPHRRRPTLVFPNLRIAGLAHLDQMEIAATRIQSHIRRMLALVVYRKKVEAKKQRLATQMQKWAVKKTWNRKFHKAMRHVSPFLIGLLLGRRRRRQAAVRLQAALRGFVKRRWLRRVLAARLRSGIMLCRWAGYRYKVHKVRQEMQRRRLARDLLQGGQSMFERTRLHWYSHFLWQGLKKTKQIEKLDHEAQRIFASMSLSGGVEVPKVFKLFRDCKGLLAGSFNTTTIELQFTKMKQGVERRMDYAKFLDLVANLAVVKLLDLDPPKTVFEELSAMKSSPAVLPKGAPVPALDPVKEKIVAFKFGSLRGRAALVSKFVHVYLSTLPEFVKVVEFLGPKSAVQQAEIVLAQAIASVQTFARNRLFIRQTVEAMRLRKQQKVDAKIFAAASKIQSVVQGFLGRRMVTRLAQSLYSKYVDGETEREYWSNPRTGHSFWTKPRLLGKYDCGTAVRMPKEDELFSVLCSNCDALHATCYCETCDAPYCTGCFASLHRTGARKAHLHVLIDNCVQCEFQIGTRFCNTCNDLFCDSCFMYMHRAGRLRFHAFERFATACDVCNQRTARWKEHGQVALGSSELSVRLKLARQGTATSTLSSGTATASAQATRYKIKMWCTVCYKEAFGEAPQVRAMSLGGTALDKILYYGRAVKKHIESKEIEKAKAIIEKAYAARKVIAEERLHNKAALVIQRVYRGHHSRVLAQAFIQQRKELMARRQQEDAIRHSLTYRFKALLGINVILETDTPLERVKKMYPWYMHHIVAVCVENNWTDACRLLVEHEQYLAKMRAGAAHRPTFLDYVKAEVALHVTRQRFERALRRFEERSAMVDDASATFYNAEASGAYGDAKLRKLKSSMNKLEKDLQRDITQKQAAEDALDAAEQRVMDIIGPRGLQLLVQDRRRAGVPLPFRLRLKNNSSLALVQYPSSLEGERSSKRGGSTRGSHRGAYAEAQQGLEGSEEGTVTRDFAADTDPMAEPPLNVTLDQYVVGQNIPGQWKSRLKVGERVYIDRILFTVAPPLIAKKRRRSGSREGSRGGSREISRDDSSRDLSHDGSQSASGRSGRRKKRHDYSELDGDDPSFGSDPDRSSAAKKPKKSLLDSVDSMHGDDFSSHSHDYSTSDVNPSSRKSARSDKSGTPGTPGTPDRPATDDPTAEPAEEVTEDHIQLDRPWLLEDAEDVEVFKVVPAVFYMQPVYALRRKLLRSYLAQKTVAVMAITNHKLAALYASMSSMFDDDSDSFARLRRWNLRAVERKGAWLRLSYRKVDMSFDFALRKRLGKVTWGLFKGLGSGLKMLSNVAKVVNSGAEETPFEYWQRSFEKEKVAVTLDLLSDQVLALGDVEMDLKAPCEIMREYIHRAFRDKLNETIGESFLFAIVDEESNKMTILPREDEYKTYSKVYAVQRVDARTFISSLAVLLVKDKLRGRVFIPEFVDKKADEDGGDGDEEEAEEQALQA